jgi:hypothetical protein
VRAALNHAGRLQAIEDAHEGDRLDIEQLGEPALLDAFVAAEICKHLPLRAGQTQPARPLLEALAHPARHVVEKKA